MYSPLYYASPGNKCIVRIDELYITKLTAIIIKTASGELIEAETSITATKYTEEDLQKIRRDYIMVDRSYYINHLTQIMGSSQSELSLELNQLVKNYNDGKSSTNPS